MLTMAAPSTAVELVELLRKSCIIPAETLEAHTRDSVPEKAVDFAVKLVKVGLITPFQAKLLLGGRYRGFRLGAYIIRDQIGQGGMGTVYLAEHETLKRHVAVKVLSLQEGGKRVAVERFLREARAAAALDHPNIVRIFDVSQQGELYFLVMEYVDGQTLDEIVEQHGALPCGRAAEYILQAAAGLEHAHEKGFVHRDIKPGNLILAKDGTLKILDMGLARSFETNDKLTEVLDNGSVVGTADYISPEQAMNHPDLDIRADIYSLGATFYAIVTGRPPFEGNTTQKLLQHQLKEAPSLTTVDKTFPPGLAAVLAKMLKKKPEDRYQTPADVMSALGPWLPNNARVVAALSCTNLGGSSALQQTLNDIVTGSTSRLPKVDPADEANSRKTSRILLHICLGVLGLAALGAGTTAALYQSDEVAGTTPTSPAWSPPAKVGEGSVTIPKPSPTKVEPTNPVVAKVPIPVAAAGPRLVYELDLTKAKPFRELGTNVANEAGKQPEMIWKVLEKSGVGPLPSGWSTSAFRNADKVETAIVEIEKRNAISLTGFEGAKSGMLFTNRSPFRAGKLEIHVEYAAAGTIGNGQLRFVALTPVRKEAVNVVKLPASNGKITRVEVEWNLEDCTSGFFEFHTASLEPNVGLFIVGMEVTEVAPTIRKPLVKLELKGLAPFAMTATTVAESGTRKLKILTETGTPKFPTSWYRWIEYPETTVEYYLETTNGKSALGMRNLTGRPGVFYTSPELTAPEKGRLELRILYQSGAGGLIRFRPSDKKPSFDVLKLPAATDGWIALIEDLDLKGHAGGFFEIATTGVGDDGALKFREFQVVPKN